MLAAAGVKYIGDWVYDDEPTVIKTTTGPLVTLPYTIECNDIPVMIIQHHNSDYLLKLVMDQFDRLYAEGRNARNSCTLAIHPYISGQPHRIKYLEADLRLREQARRRAALERRARSSTGTAALPRSRPPHSVGRRPKQKKSGRGRKEPCASREWYAPSLVLPRCS